MKRAVITACVAGGLILVGAIQTSADKKVRETRHGNVDSAPVIHAATRFHPEQNSARRNGRTIWPGASSAASYCSGLVFF
jgi:hypothetical protein